MDDAMGKQVTIIGAGPIGLILAKELAGRGINVTVYDSKQKVSDGTAKASGIFSRAGLSRLGVDYSRHHLVVNELDGATLHAGRESFKVETGEPVAYIFDRGEFAAACAKEAAEAGAKIVLGKRFGKDEILKMKGDPENILVGADGAVSLVASSCGFPVINEYILTYKAEYENACVEDVHKVGLFFSKRIANRFFGWTAPYSGSRLEIGIGISNRSRRNSLSIFEEFVHTEQMAQLLQGATKTAGYASLIPLEARRKTVIGNVLLVGDAAGQVKATTGGGVIFGGACAKIAARAIEAHIKHGKPLEGYEREWRKLYGLDLRMHRLIHAYYSVMGDRSFAMVIKAAKLLGFEKFLSEHGDMDRPSLMLKRFFIRNS